jgi:hydroxypyruvate isomerase
MIKPAICFEMLYDDEKPQDKIKKIAAAGFEYAEFWGWRDKDIDALKTTCDECGVNISIFSGQRVGDLVNRATHDLVVQDYKDAIKTAEKLETSILMVLTNELGEEGVVVNTYDALSASEKDDAVVDGLKKISALIPERAVVVLEPLNTVKDHVGYHINDLESAFSVIDRVGSPKIKILCDLYHQGMMGDDLTVLIKKYVDRIGYFHIADFPGRHEPGAGSADWKHILTEIKGSGYDGFVGFEYAPAGDSTKSLIAIKDLWDSVF